MQRGKGGGWRGGEWACNHEWAWGMHKGHHEVKATKVNPPAVGFFHARKPSPCHRQNPPRLHRHRPMRSWFSWQRAPGSYPWWIRWIARFDSNSRSCKALAAAAAAAWGQDTPHFWIILSEIEIPKPQRPPFSTHTPRYSEGISVFCKMGIPLELVRYSVEDGKFHVGQAAVDVLKKVTRTYMRTQDAHCPFVIGRWRQIDSLDFQLP